MRPAGPALTRRSLLVATGLTALTAACRDDPRPGPAGAPDAAALAAARDGERRLLAAYDALVAAAGGGPELEAGRAAHRAHLAALEALATPTASPGAPASPAPATTPTVDVAADERSSVPGLHAAAVAARSGAVAAVLASVAASHAALGRRGAR